MFLFRGRDDQILTDSYAYCKTNMDIVALAEINLKLFILYSFLIIIITHITNIILCSFICIYLYLSLLNSV